MSPRKYIAIFFRQSGGEDEPMSPDNEYNSRDGDSPRGGRGENDSAVSPTPRLPGPPPNNDVDSDALEKLRQQVRSQDTVNLLQHSYKHYPPVSRNVRSVRRLKKS